MCLRDLVYFSRLRLMSGKENRAREQGNDLPRGVPY